MQTLLSILESVNYRPVMLNNLSITGAEPVLPARFKIATAAAAAIAATGLAASELFNLRNNTSQDISVDLHDAALAMRSHAYMQVVGEEPPKLWSPLSGFYQTKDKRYVQLHCNFPHHAAGVVNVLQCENTQESVAAAIKTWQGQQLEDTLAKAGMCASLIRTPEEWAHHPQAQAIASLPLMEIIKVSDSKPEALTEADRPLTGIRALDLTRVIAGPITGRTLAEHGAEVLRIGSPNLPSIPGLVIDTGFGKRSAFLDLQQDADRNKLKKLVQQTDIFSQGYRPDSLAQRGFSMEELIQLRPGIICVNLSAYSHVGPWANRRGFDSLVQSATGIAYEHAGGYPPQHLPAQVLDYVSGYLGAFGTMVALQRRAEEGGSYLVRISLAQTAHWLNALGRLNGDDVMQRRIPEFNDVKDKLLCDKTPFGDVYHLKPVIQLSKTLAHWSHVAVPLGSDSAEW